MGDIIEFKKRPENRDAGKPAAPKSKLVQFAVAMAMVGLVFFLLPTLWASAPVHLLTVIHLLIAAVYLQQGLRLAAGLWIALTLVVLVLTGAPSPVTYALNRGAQALDAAVTR